MTTAAFAHTLSPPLTNSANPTSTFRPKHQSFTKFVNLKRSATTLSHLQKPPVSAPDSGVLFREKLVYLESHLNVNSTKALQLNPDIRASPLSALKSVERCLLSMGIERQAFGRIFDMYPQLLTCDPYVDLYPVFDFLLNDVGLAYEDVRTAVVRCPRLLVCDADEQLRPTLAFLQRLGFVGANAITCQTTVLLVSSVEHTLLPKLEYLEGLGFRSEEVVRMVLRSPGLLTFSIEKNFKPKVAYFLEEMGGELAELKCFPQYFSFSLEGKIKPRHQVLMRHGLEMGLPEMLKPSDGEFNARVLELRLGLHSRYTF
uniref:Uncharacterized protein n=1 Tax=Kalanchoe fedtschenkoi TaxID=63787 RepID=A0A7N0UJS6_KALFE